MAATQQPASETARPPSPVVSPGRRLDYVDSLRGIACFWVLLIHSYNPIKGQQMLHGVSAFSPERLFFTFSSMGWLGVNLFLVLSGFCLFLPLVRRNDPRQISLNLRDFAWRRAHRILPPYYIALLVLVILESVPVLHLTPLVWGDGKAVKDVLLHLFMLHNFQPDTIDSINIVFWSLALESQLYIVFPLVVLSGRKIGMVPTLAVALAVSLACQFLLSQHVGLAPPYVSTLYRSVPSRGFEFVAGMMAAALVARPHAHQTRLAAALALFLLPFGVWYALQSVGVAVLLSQTWGVIFACLLILGSRVPEGWFRHSGLATLTFLGTISYSVYLVHAPLFNLIHPDRLHLHLSGGKTVLFDALRLPLVIGLGYLFFLVAERPFMNRKKALIQRPGVP